jgi:hypothetical protein
MSLTKATYSMIEGAVLNVQDFGATGDGTTNDTAAIQAAIAFAEASATPPSAAPGVVTIYFPFGFYSINAALIVTKSISFFGEGHSEYSSGARIIQNTAATDNFTVQPIAAGCSVSWDNLTLIANGNGGTNGNCINITKTTATCNSVRIRGCTFGTPQTLAIRLQSSDDIIIDGNLFDVSAVNCIALGTATAGDVVNNCSITNNAFFQIGQKSIDLYNVVGLLISNNRVYPSAPGAAKMTLFIDGVNTLPYQIKNVVVNGNRIDNVESLAQLKDPENFIFSSNTCTALGASTGSAFSAIELTGTACNGVSINGNIFSGTFDTKNFYNDAGATVVNANIAANTFVNAGGAGQALAVANSTGSILQNKMTSFTTNSVGQQWYTTGNAISPGTLSSLATYTYTATVTGARQGDKVTLTPSSTTWPAPAGIVVTSFISASNTVSIQYTNVTGSPIGVPAHDFGILVTR